MNPLYDPIQLSGKNIEVENKFLTIVNVGWISLDVENKFSTIANKGSK